MKQLNSTEEISEADDSNDNDFFVGGKTPSSSYKNNLSKRNDDGAKSLFLYDFLFAVVNGAVICLCFIMLQVWLAYGVDECPSAP